MMHLLPNDIRERLLQNGRMRAQCQRDDICDPDFIPVVKLFTSAGACTWLLTELDPDAPDIAFGLCDLGTGFPQLGSVSISEIESVCDQLDVALERDVHFDPVMTIWEYTEDAREHGAIRA